MSGRGKGGKGKGKVGMKRHADAEKKMGLSKAAVKKIGRRAAVQRISKGSISMTQEIAAKFIENIVAFAGQYTRYCRRKTITGKDVQVALDRYGFKIYGAQVKK